MACKINIHNIEALPPIYPKGFQRQVDITKAFRAWTAFAAVRAVMPISGKGRSDFYDILDKDSIPPYGDKGHDGEIDIYRVISALFTCDGGESEVLEYGSEDSMTIGKVSPGRTVFSCVKAAREREIKLPYNKENAAMRGEAHCCFASKYPYRYWWQVFNKAIWNLLNNHVKADKVLVGTIYDDETGKTTEEYVNILPYTFGVRTGVSWGKPSYDLGYLRVDWTETAEAAQEIIKVEGNERSFFPEAINIDTRGVFKYIGTPEGEVRTNEGVAKLWPNFAKSAGFTQYCKDYSPEQQMQRDRITFIDYINFKLGSSRIDMFKDGLLKTIAKDLWTGDTWDWDSPFPFHGFLAMYYFISLFIESKCKYAVTYYNPDNDPLIGMQPTPQYKQKYRVSIRAEEEFTDVPRLGQDYPIYDFENPTGEKTDYVKKDVKKLNWEVELIEPIGEPYVTYSKGATIGISRQPILTEVLTEGVSKIDYVTPIESGVFNEETPNIEDYFIPLFKFKVTELPSGAREYEPADEATRDFVLEAHRVTLDNEYVDPFLQNWRLNGVGARFFDEADKWISNNSKPQKHKAVFRLTFEIETDFTEGDDNGYADYAKKLCDETLETGDEKGLYLPKEWGDEWGNQARKEMENKYCFVKTNFSSCILPLSELNLINKLKLHLGLPEEANDYSGEEITKRIQNAKESIITDTGDVSVSSNLFRPEFRLANEVEMVDGSYMGRRVHIPGEEEGDVGAWFNFPMAIYTDINKENYELEFEWKEDSGDETVEETERVLGVYIYPWAGMKHGVNSKPSKEEIDKYKKGEEIEVEKAEVEYFNSITFVEFDKSISG